MSTNVRGNRKAIFIAVYRNVLRIGKSNRKLLFIGNIPRSVLLRTEWTVTIEKGLRNQRFRTYNIIRKNNIRYDSVKWPMKKRAKEKRLKWTLKTVDILSCGSLPPPLTERKRTAVCESPTAKNSRTVWIFRRLQQCSSSFSCHQGQAALRWLG